MTPLKKPLKKIGIVLDNPKRDLYGVLLLAYQIASRGQKAYIVPYYHQSYDVPLLGLHSLIANFVRSANIKLLHMAKRMGTLTSVMDTEGGVLSEDGVDSPKNWAKHLRETKLARGVDLYFTWGKKVQEAFAEFSGINPHFVQQTGCPRYDLCHPKWRPFIEYGDRDYVLMNTNYSAVNPKFTRSHADELDAFIKAGWDAEYAKNLIGDLQVVWQNFLDTAEKLFTALPEQTFLVRPHPFESPEPYEKRFAHLKNVRVDGTGNVFNVIANCRLMIHLNCGSAIETLLLGKLPVALEFLNNPIQLKHTPLPTQVSYHAKSFDELVDIVKNPKQAEARFASDALYAEYIEPFFGARDGQAAIRIVDRTLHELQKRTLTPKTSWLDTLRGSVEEWDPKRLVQGALSLTLGSHRAEAIRTRLNPKRLEKTVTAEMAQTMLDKLAEIDGAGRKIRVSHAKHPLTGVALESLEIELA